jgi:ssDNA thymidine ADP-ribosyltransferase DarT-like protein
LIFRITHIDNVPWLLTNGVQCRNSDQIDPNFVAIGCPDLIDRRRHRIVPIAPKGTLSDYVPFYFTPHSPMLLNIKTGRNGVQQRHMSEIVILVSSLRRAAELGLPFVFTNRHAFTNAAEYFSDLDKLGEIDWKILRARDFKKDLNDPGKMERYMAEALIYRQVPVSTLLGLACYNSGAEERVRGFLRAAGLSLKTAVKPDWYF